MASNPATAPKAAWSKRVRPVSYTHLLSRGILYHLAQNRVFDRYALLDENEVGCVRAVCDEQLRPLEAAP